LSVIDGAPAVGAGCGVEGVAGAVGLVLLRFASANPAVPIIAANIRLAYRIPVFLTLKTSARFARGRTSPLSRTLVWFIISERM
jgi:hypothetical protein